MCFLPSLTASSVLRGVGAQGSSKNAEGGGDCHTPVPGELWEALHQAPSIGLALSPVPGNAGLHMAGLVSAGCGQLSWAIPEASRAPLPVLRWPHCLLEPLCKFSQPLFTHPPVEAGGCGLCLVSSMTSWARGRPSLPRPARAPSTPGFGHFPVAPQCDLRPGLPWIGPSWIRSSSLSVQAPGCCPPHSIQS